MNRISITLLAIALPAAFAAPAFAQEGRTLGTVVNGNTTIEFKAADSSDIDLQKLQTWSTFASAHPDVAHELAYKPSLINSDSYTAGSIRNSASSFPRIRTFAKRWQKIPAITSRFRHVPANSLRSPGALKSWTVNSGYREFVFLTARRKFLYSAASAIW